MSGTRNRRRLGLVRRVTVKAATTRPRIRLLPWLVWRAVHIERFELLRKAPDNAINAAQQLTGETP